MKKHFKFHGRNNIMKTVRENKTNRHNIGKEMLLAKLFSSLRFKLIVSFSIPIILIVILGIVSFQMAASGIRNNYESTENQVIGMTGQYIRFGINSIEDTAIEYINDKTVTKYFLSQYQKDSLDYITAMNSIQNMINTKSTADEFVGNIYMISDDTASISSDQSSEKILATGLYAGYLKSETGKFMTNHNKQSIWEGNDSYLDDQLGTSSSDYCMRLIQKFQSSNAMIIIDVRSKTVEDILKNTKFDKSGMIGLVTSDGKEIIANQNKKTVFTNQVFYKNAVSSKNSEDSEYVKYNNKEYLFMYSKIEGTDAMICALIPKSTIISQADRIKKVTAAIVIVACLIAVLIGLLISTGISKTINEIIMRLKKAAKGDLTVEFSTRRKDEFKILIDELHITFANIKNLLKRVNLMSKEVSGSSTQVNHTSSAFLKSTDNISNAIGEIEQGIAQQAKDAEECLMQMDNLSKKISLVGDIMEEISRIADQTKTVINTGTVCTQDLNRQTISTIEITTDIVQAIEVLEQKSKTVTNITNVINDIANQTNLLSLNASIEAARAGEYGRGFSVVAEEIRLLANKSKESVDDINKIIVSIQSDTKNAADIAKKAENILGLQETVVKNTTHSYQEISESVEKLMEFLKSISENVYNIEESRISTLGAIESISAVLEEIAASSNTVHQTATDQLNAVEALNQSAEALTDNANQLFQDVQKFTVENLNA